VTYDATIEFLFGLRLHGQKLGLATMRELLARVGNPQDALRFIHIAGTNGKGSVAAMCHAVLSRTGRRTGLYTSPHLVSFTERFQVNGQPISQADVVRLVAQLRPHLDQTRERPPTFFEIVTALALLYFREQNVEIVVWETGLGGRLDATNVVTPLVSVITNVAFDHMQYLGETLAEIAGEKAGIIKPGVPVVTAARAPAALAVIRQTCREKGCRLTEVTEPLGWETGLAGAHQRWNCATAVAALRLVGVADDVIRQGLRQTRWPGRFQLVRESPPVILDGAHNPAAAEVLVAAIRERFAGQPVTLILGVLRDKDCAAVCRHLASVAARIICVPVKSERTSDPQELARWCREANPQTAVETATDLATAYARATGVVVITGSLFLVGEALGTLDFGTGQPVSSARERALQ
jgi:dihydrofolate synthase/folylpolyglutamate synthase